jgi:hypothetical protein
MRAKKQENTMTTTTNDTRHLCDADTSEFIRIATAEEASLSDAEVEAGRLEGFILVDGRCCYVAD